MSTDAFAHAGRDAEASAGDAPLNQLTYEVAETLEQVESAWRLVYGQYRSAELVDANAFELYTNRHAVHPDTHVVIGSFEGAPRSTLSWYHDREGGLPLDEIYQKQLQVLREKGGRLFEVGLLAERRFEGARGAEALFALMRFPVLYGLHAQRQLTIGVHPRHARFYSRRLGFDVIGPERVHPKVRHAPVVLLYLDPAEKFALNPLPRGLAHFKRNPVPPEVFDRHYRFDDTALTESPIMQLLNGGAQTKAA